MSKGFSIDDVLGDQSKVTRPAGTRMDIVMLPIGDIVENPENAIYEIGDVGMLQADIAEHGLRTPLEVTPAGGKYMLVAGHRRHTACMGLHEGGDARFDRLPCIVVNYASQDEELVALITSNATARELTDGERLRQYEALKGALTRLKAEGKVEGRVREELARRTGEGSGTLARLNAICCRCVPEVRAMLERGEITQTRAYDASKLYKVQQLQFAKTGFGPIPSLSPDEKAVVVDCLVRDVLHDTLAACDYGPGRDQWNFFRVQDLSLGPLIIHTEDGQYYRVSVDGYAGLQVDRLDPTDEEEITARSLIYLRDLYPLAKELYCPPEVRQAEAQAKKDQRAAAKRERDEEKHLQALAQERLAAYDTWPKVDQAKELGLVFRAYALQDGGRLVVAVDETTRRDGFPGLPYERSFYARFDAQGRRVDMMDGKVNSITSLFSAWRADGDLAPILERDIKAQTKAEE